VCLQALADVVVDTLGGKCDSEETLQQIWQAASNEEKTKSK
jgi:hypothetical protein